MNNRRHLCVSSTWQQFDQTIATLSHEYQQQGGRLYCRKGCGNCCTLAVNCSYPEAILLAAALTDQQRDQVRGRLPLLEQLCQTATDLKTFLQSYREQAGGCPLLDAEARCSCYAVRPLSCRALLSTRPEAWCGVDFSTLHPLEKKAFLSSLDTDRVAFPSHYLARPLELAAERENALDEEFAHTHGVRISGNLIWMLGLELKEQLSTRLEQQEKRVIAWLLEQQQRYPYLLQVTVR